MTDTADIGLIGLGTMGSALALNIADKGFRISVFNRTASRTDDFIKEAGSLGPKIEATYDLAQFVTSLSRPRKIILMVPAGKVVDQQIAFLGPLLDEGDIILDCGNANYSDTNCRIKQAFSQVWEFLGVGVSGGEEGARHGPSIMVGGNKAIWEMVSPVLLAIAARHTDGTPCAAWLGEAGAGHFVKMVHNGIEYADMQMIAEIYGLLRDGYGWSAGQVGDLFSKWNEGLLKSYLVEITAEIAACHDEKSDGPLLDIIVDSAGQKGTGRWTAIEALHLGTPVPVIDAAVGARNMSARRELRQRGEKHFGWPGKPFSGEPDITALEGAMIAGKILCYAQGFAMLAEAAKEYGWTIPLDETARIWRAGCIIRSAMLDDMARALSRPLDNLVFDPYFTDLLLQNRDGLRETSASALSHGFPVPALSSGLAWFDQLCSERSTANLIQGQRDFFGLHGFERLDSEGDFHGPWADD